jgi:hypothetical protein
MEGSGSGGRHGAGGQQVIDPSNPGEFVDYVISSFESNRMAVDSAVVAYIRKEVIVEGREWEDGVRNGRIDLAQTQEILAAALGATAALAERVGRPMIDLTLATPTLDEVIEGRGCPYPFRRC